MLLLASKRNIKKNVCYDFFPHLFCEMSQFYMFCLLPLKSMINAYYYITWVYRNYRYYRGRRGGVRMVVAFITTYAISTYHH